MLSLGPTPRVDTETWLLSIDGAVPFVLDWDGLQAAPQTDWPGDIHCVTRWSEFGMRWRGIAVAELLARAEPLADATHLLAHCYGATRRTCR